MSLKYSNFVIKHISGLSLSLSNRLQCSTRRLLNSSWLSEKCCLFSSRTSASIETHSNHYDRVTNSLSARYMLTLHLSMRLSPLLLLLLLEQRGKRCPTIGDLCQEFFIEKIPSFGFYRLRLWLCCILSSGFLRLFTIAPSHRRLRLFRHFFKHWRFLPLPFSFVQFIGCFRFSRASRHRGHLKRIFPYYHSSYLSVKSKVE